MPLSPDDFCRISLDEAKRYQPFDGHDAYKGYSMRNPPRAEEVSEYGKLEIIGAHERIVLPGGFVELTIGCIYTTKAPDSYDLREALQRVVPRGVLRCKQLHGSNIVTVDVNLESEVISDCGSSSSFGTPSVWPSFSTFLRESENSKGHDYRSAVTKFMKDLYAANEGLGKPQYSGIPDSTV